MREWSNECMRECGHNLIFGNEKKFFCLPIQLQTKNSKLEWRRMKSEYQYIWTGYISHTTEIRKELKLKRKPTNVKRCTERKLEKRERDRNHREKNLVHGAFEECPDRLGYSTYTKNTSHEEAYVHVIEAEAHQIQHSRRELRREEEEWREKEKKNNRSGEKDQIMAATNFEFHFSFHCCCCCCYFYSFLVGCFCSSWSLSLSLFFFVCALRQGSSSIYFYKRRKKTRVDWFEFQCWYKARDWNLRS